MAASVDLSKMPPLALKRRAVEYYRDNGVPKCIEVLLNKMFYDKPEDIFGYMSDYFSRAANPVSLAKIRLKPTLSSSGHESFEVTLQGVQHGIEKDLLSLRGPLSWQSKEKTPRLRLIKTPGPSRDAKGKGDKKANQNASRTNLVSKLLPEQSLDYKAFTAFIEHDLNDYLRGIHIDNVNEVEEALCLCLEASTAKRFEFKANDSLEDEAADKKNEFAGTDLQKCSTCSTESRELEIANTKNAASLFISSAITTAVANLKQKRLYEEIIGLLPEGEEKRSLALPTVVIPLMTCGVMSPGKLNMIKELCIVPSQGITLREQANGLMSVHHRLGDLLVTKYGVNGCLCNDDGLYCPVGIDKQEQVFEIIDALTQSTDDEQCASFKWIVNVAASEIYDKDKNSYEISNGTFKSSADMVSMLAEFQEKHRILGFIDPVSCEDLASFAELQRHLSGKCYLFQNMDNPFVEAQTVETIAEIASQSPVCTSVLSKSFSITTACNGLNEVKDMTPCLMLQSKPYSTSGSRLNLHLAIALGIPLLKIGSPSRVENIDIINELISIESQLQTDGQLVFSDDYSFPVVQTDRDAEKAHQTDICQEDDADTQTH